MKVGLFRESVDLESLRKKLSSQGNVGAVLTFTGIVRPYSEGKKVVKLYYDYYEELALKQLAEIRDEALKRFNLIDALIYHRVGEAKVGDLVLVVMVASERRKNGFEALTWIVNRVKSGVAIWKKEYFEGGERWVEPD